MELFIELHDHAAIVHKKNLFEFGSDATLKELKQTISSVFNINKNYLNIFFENGVELEGLSETSLASLGLKHGMRVIAKHSDLPLWIAYKKCLDLVIEKTDDKKANARDAVRHHKHLMKCGFFDAYLQFDDYRKQKHSKVASWPDWNINLIRDATEQYFHCLHDLKRGSQESDFVCKFEDKGLELGGRSTSTLAFVRIHGEDLVSKYYIKCHHFGPKDTSSGQPPDINELYCYKLLELIGVGSKCHIVPPIITTGTKMSVYIATKWSDKFELMEQVIKENSLNADIVVQLVLLRMLLFIADLHPQNCGVWRGTNNIAIVDFGPENEITVHDDIKVELFTTFPHAEWKEEFKAVKNELSENSWLKIAKQNLDKWDLSRKIVLAQEQLDPIKDVLERMELGSKKRKSCHSSTDQLKKYVDILNKNLENLQIVLNSTVHQQ